MALDEDNDGTRRDSAEGYVEGMGEGPLFSVTSGDAPYTSWPEAVAHLWLQRAVTSGGCTT